MGVEIQRIRQAKGTVSDHWLSRSSCWFRCPDRSTSCITSWKKFVFHGKRSQSVLHWDVKNAFLQGAFDDSVVNGELVAEPVPELRKALLFSQRRVTALLTHQDVSGSHSFATRNSWYGEVVDMNHV